MTPFRVTVKRYNDRNRPTAAWVVNIYDPRKDASKKRHRMFFPTRPEAEAEASARRTEFESIGLLSLNLSPRQKIEAWDAYERIKPFEVSLAYVIDYYVERHQHFGEPIQNVLKTYDEYCIRIGRAERTLQNQRGFYTRFLAENEDKKSIGDFQQADIEKWLLGTGKGPETYNTYRALLSAFFEFAVKKGYVKENPVRTIETMRVSKEKVCIFTPEQIHLLLNTALTLKEYDILAAFALGAFAGLRPESEFKRLTYEAVDLRTPTEKDNDLGLIDVSAENKTAQHRYVKILPTLARWLAKIPHGQGLIASANFRKRFEAVREKAGITWGHDILRHSYASYHLAYFEDAAALQLQMGHTDTSMIFGNYRQRVRKSEAEKWWAIAPEGAVDALLEGIK